jgi:fido (protein-threonine AMPylation protein)
MIEEILPKYLYREQYHKCVKTLEEIYYWTRDKFYHELNAIHEFVLGATRIERIRIDIW